MRLNNTHRKLPAFLIFGLLAVLGCLIAVGIYMYRTYRANIGRSGQVMKWLRNPSAYPDWAVKAGQRCGSAPFHMPTDGFIGFLWDDSFRIGHHHQGIDIFGGSDVNQTPVVVAYPGYLTRLPDWKSTVIIRIPNDPLQPGRQIWTYYTHMASFRRANPFVVEEFPPGMHEQFVGCRRIIRLPGNFSGTPGNPTGVHLHFSIVLDDGKGQFLNELEIKNTLDPSPYLGLPLNANDPANLPPVCPG